MLLYWLSKQNLMFAKRVRLFLIILLIVCGRGQSLADAFVQAPRDGGPQTYTNSIFPFLIKQIDAPLTATMPTMRYQQVYNQSLFTNLDPGLIYVTTLSFTLTSTQLTNPITGWTIPKMQVNVSTTPKTADHLSPVFSENVGPDDTIVIGPVSYVFPGSGAFQALLFNRPFRYNPAQGNLLLDVRILDGSGSLDPFNPTPRFFALNSPSDESSRVWATNVAATTASGIDTVGLATVVQLSPVPSIQIYTSYFGSSTDYIAVQWPSQPSTFFLQRSLDRVTWQNASLTGYFSNDTFQGIYFPLSSAGAGAFYRLIWPGGKGQVQPALFPVAAAPPSSADPRKNAHPKTRNEN
jgi:hypothetical protein